MLVAESGLAIAGELGMVEPAVGSGDEVVGLMEGGEGVVIRLTDRDAGVCTVDCNVLVADGMITV